MTKEIQEILCKAISDVGLWVWWDFADDCAMIEFDGVKGIAHIGIGHATGDEKAFDYAVKILHDYKNNNSKETAVTEDKIRNAKHILSGRCGYVGFILGGDEIQVIGNKGQYKPEEIKAACEKWWEYWKEYWRVRGTKDAYDQDYACEVTIPCR